MVNIYITIRCVYDFAKITFLRGASDYHCYSITNIPHFMGFIWTLCHFYRNESLETSYTGFTTFSDELQMNHRYGSKALLIDLKCSKVVSVRALSLLSIPFTCYLHCMYLPNDSWVLSCRFLIDKVHLQVSINQCVVVEWCKLLQEKSNKSENDK